MIDFPLRATALAKISVLVLGVVAALLGSVSCSRAPSPEEAESLGRLEGRLERIEQRKTRIEDSNQIKRLQRAYGYYVDQGLWDQIADMFTENGSIEIGLDGVYVGKERVREYLYALGGGKSGLSEGALNEHIQVMPVVTVAPDGNSAKVRARAVILAGKLGESALWGEGPYENEYVKEDGVWKLSRVHWYQSMLVPYEGGWQVNADVNGAKYVSDRLPPDRPPSVSYGTWPDTYLPPFHFANPVLGARPDPEIEPEVVAAESVRPLDELAASAAGLAQEIQLLEDENAIEILQRTYGFYTDKQLWTQAADLFADDGTIEVGNRGVYVGKARVLAYLRHLGPEFPQQGRLFDQMQLQPIVHVAPDGLSAKARWHMFAQEARHGEFARWGLGVYENEYVKQDGVWKIKSLHQYTRMYTPYEDGWGKTALPLAGPFADLPPDRPPSARYTTYPAVFAAPFHYENPVGGPPVYNDTAADFAPAPARNIEELAVTVASLEHRVGLLEDADQIERLNRIYGYYLARNQWDDLAGIFSRDGEIEIAMRGIYVGPASVRRNLDLYGEAGIQHGLLHNHMQYQPVIHVADDGLTAKMRSRAFSIMGQFEAYSMWMGGIYENGFVKEDGIWKIKHDQQLNTYFAPYAVGWKDLAPRPPPGITDANPPDLPPSLPFEMYPSAFLPPFHYANPVTGETVAWP